MPACEGVVEHASGHAAGLHQRIRDGGRVLSGPPYETAARVGAAGGGKRAVEHAADDGDVVVAAGSYGHETAVGAVAALAAVDVDRTTAACEGQRTVRRGHEARGPHIVGVDGTSDLQVCDGGVLHVAERGAAVLSEGFERRAFRDGQRVAVAVECTLERIELVVTLMSAV